MSERTHSLVAILPCNNMAESMVFYGRLGFRLAIGDEEYAMLEDGKGAQIHLQPAVEGWLVPGSNPFGLYLYTEQVDDLAREFANELLNATGPEDKSWGMYEFALSDPDATLVRIGWPTRLRAVATAR
jgi:hypothetical protein